MSVKTHLERLEKAAQSNGWNCCKSASRIVLPNPDGSLPEGYDRCPICGKQLTGFGIILDIDLRRSSEREKVEQDEPQN